MKRALIDYLEVLRYAGVEDWGPFPITSGRTDRIPDERENGRTQAEERNTPAEHSVTVFPDVSGYVPEENIVSENILPRPFPNPTPLRTPDTTPPEAPLPEMPKKTSTKPSSGTLDRPTALALLAAEVAQCRRCGELAPTRTQTVFGTGHPHATLVFLGEAPGADEDMQGVPFVGRAGQLLNDMITKGMKLKREEVYICNILRCRPPGNRNPDPAEAEHCRPFLDRTLEILQPKFICCLGAVAAQNLLRSEETIGNLRGKIHRYGGAKVVCTYHPAYLLRTASAKAKAWEDLQLLMKEMGLPLRKR